MPRSADCSVVPFGNNFTFVCTFVKWIHWPARVFRWLSLPQTRKLHPILLLMYRFRDVISSPSTMVTCLIYAVKICGWKQSKIHHDDNVIKWKHFRVTGPLWGESTDHRWIFLTKAHDAERWYFLSCAPEKWGLEFQVWQIGNVFSYMDLIQQHI